MLCSWGAHNVLGGGGGGQTEKIQSFYTVNLYLRAGMTTYERTENFDALLSCGMTENTAEALDRFLQEGYIEELSSDLIDKFALMNETSASQCLDKIKKLKKKNLPVSLNSAYMCIVM